MKKLYVLSFLILMKIAGTSQPLDWASTMGSAGSDIGTSLARDNSGNIYVTGFFTNTADFDPGTGTFNLTSAGNEDIFISKLDPNGNLLWAKRIGGVDGDRGFSIAVDASGNSYVTGAFIGTVDFDPDGGVFNMSSAAGYGDMYVVKLNTSGNLAWAEQFGGNGSITGYSITLDASGFLYTTGSFVGTIDFDPGAGTNNLTSTGTYDIFVNKLDNSGNQIWTKRMGGTTGFEVNVSNAIAVDAGGNIYTTGAYEDTTDFDPGPGYYPLDSTGFFICKLNSSGDLVWVKTIISVNVTGNAITIDNSGNVITTGSFAYAADFDTGPGTFYMWSPGRNIFVLKMDASGNFLWAKEMGSGVSGSYGYGVATDAGGNIFTTGSVGGTADMDPGAGNYDLTSYGAEDIFISKLSPSGNFVCATQMGGVASDYGYAIILDASANTYLTGAFSISADLDPGSGTYTATSAGYEDIYVLKAAGCSTSVGVNETETDNSITLFPNPSKGKFTVRSENASLRGKEIEIFNALGIKLRSITLETSSEIDMHELSPGVYFLKIPVKDQIVLKKIVIE